MSEVKIKGKPLAAEPSSRILLSSCPHALNLELQPTVPEMARLGKSRLLLSPLSNGSSSFQCGLAGDFGFLWHDFKAGFFPSHHAVKAGLGRFVGML